MSLAILTKEDNLELSGLAKGDMIKKFRLFWNSLYKLLVANLFNVNFVTEIEERRDKAGPSQQYLSKEVNTKPNDTMGIIFVLFGSNRSPRSHYVRLSMTKCSLFIFWLKSSSN